ncbi:MAG: hypothetical protein NZ729_02280 [Methylococcales bacterium]|nr:hypothetical protein [Methylococcales bacterium]
MSDLKEVRIGIADSISQRLENICGLLESALYSSINSELLDEIDEILICYPNIKKGDVLDNTFRSFLKATVAEHEKTLKRYNFSEIKEAVITHLT